MVTTGSRPKNCSERLWTLSGGDLGGRVGHWTQGLLIFLVVVISAHEKQLKKEGFSSAPDLRVQSMTVGRREDRHMRQLTLTASAVRKWRER